MSNRTRVANKRERNWRGEGIYRFTYIPTSTTRNEQITLWVCAVCLLRSNLIAIIKQAHGATPTSNMAIGASQTRLLDEVLVTTIIRLPLPIKKIEKTNQRLRFPFEELCILHIRAALSKAVLPPLLWGAI